MLLKIHSFSLTIFFFDFDFENLYISIYIYIYVYKMQKLPCQVVGYKVPSSNSKIKKIELGFYKYADFFSFFFFFRFFFNCLILQRVVNLYSKPC